MRIKQEKLWSAYNMEKTENAVRSRLLEAGKEEFRDRGFLKASLRAICKKADVTTGALYFFFESKAALFEEIVKETVEKLKELTGDFSNRENSCSQKNMTEFLWNLSGKTGISQESLWMERKELDMTISGKIPV